MIDKILKLKSFPSEFTIENQKKKYLEFDNSLPDYFVVKQTLSKKDVINLIQEKKFSKKTELLAILFWGLYFKVNAKNPKSIKILIEFINSKDFDNEIIKRVSQIIESKSPSELFYSFSKELKIPGLDYAYFTKLFYFYRIANNKEPFLILDKWLCRAWCAIDGHNNKNTYIFDTYFKTKSFCDFHGVLMRRKHIAYNDYILFMKDIANSKNLTIDSLEEKLFGADKKQFKEGNPRNFYLEWAQENNILINRQKNISQNKHLLVSKSNHDFNDFEVFFLKQTEHYIGIYRDDKKKQKEGYINKKGWLNISENLKNRLSSIKDWSNGNTNGGSKEKYKFKFVSQDDAIDFLKSQNFQIKL